jgi:very-short-patch-repair endonuclease
VTRRRTVIPFDVQCRAVGLPPPVAEHRFHPVRRWRYDFAWIEQKVALEVQGAIFTAGRHTRGAALVKEHEKLNAAAALGWRVLFVTPKQIANGEALTVVESALKATA